MPALTLDFQNSQQLDPRVTFSRSSSATYINSAGQVASAADHEARFDHDGNGECLGLLIEESRTNHCLYSDVDPTNWHQNGTSSLAVSSVPAPDGGTCYDLTTDTGGPNSVRQRSNTSAPVGTSVLSVFARFPNAGFTSLNIRNFNAGGGANYYADYIPATDSWDGEVACTGLPSEDLGNGWKRLTVVSTVTSSNGNNWVNIGGGISSSAFTQQTCQIWGAQLEEGSFGTSYIPTSGSTVTRSADIAQITGDNFSSWYNQGKGTLFAQWVSPDTKQFSSPAIIKSSTAKNGPRIYVYAYTANKLIGMVKTPSESATILTTSYVPNTNLKTAIAYSTSSQSSTFNGNTSQTANITTSIPTMVRMDIGDVYATNDRYSNHHIARLSYYNERLTDAELQTITS